MIPARDVASTKPSCVPACRSRRRCSGCDVVGPFGLLADTDAVHAHERSNHVAHQRVEGWLDELDAAGIRPCVVVERSGLTTVRQDVDAKGRAAAAALTAELARRGDHTPGDVGEAAEVGWLPLADVPHLISTAGITDGPTLIALGYNLGVHRALGSGSA